MTPRLKKKKTYEELLEELNLFGLTKHGVRRDLIEVFQIFKGCSNLNGNKYFIIDHSNITINNGCEIIPKHVKSHDAKHFVFKRIVNI